MFRKLIKNKKAQQTAEYALLISLVVAAVIAMQTYAQRALQGRIRDASQYLTANTNALGSTNQYEPYYLATDYTVGRDESQTEYQSSDTIGYNFDGTRGRELGGYQESQYNAAGLSTDI